LQILVPMIGDLHPDARSDEPFHRLHGFRSRSRRLLSLVFIAFSLAMGGCAVSSAPFEERVDRTPGFDATSLAEGGVAVMPVIADSGATEYRRPLLEGLYDELHRLAADVRVVPADTVRPALQVDGRASAYREAYATYRRTSVLSEEPFLDIVRELDERSHAARYLVVVFVRHPRVYFNPHEGPHKDLSTRQTVEAVGLAWDARSKSVVWEAEVGAGSKTNAFERHGDSSVAMSRKAGVALARSLLRRWTEPPAETPAETPASRLR